MKKKDLVISRKDVGHYIDLINSKDSILDEFISFQLIELLWELLALREYKEKLNKEIASFLEGLSDE